MLNSVSIPQSDELKRWLYLDELPARKWLAVSHLHDNATGELGALVG